MKVGESDLIYYGSMAMRAKPEALKKLNDVERRSLLAMMKALDPRKASNKVAIELDRDQLVALGEKLRGKVTTEKKVEGMVSIIKKIFRSTPTVDELVQAKEKIDEGRFRLPTQELIVGYKKEIAKNKLMMEKLQTSRTSDTKQEIARLQTRNKELKKLINQRMRRT